MDNRALIQRSLDHIEDNLEADLSAEELADMAGFSLFHYYRLFQQATGMPVMQYILRRRLLHGVYAISKGSGKTDAAFSYGFDTYAGFYKAFQREFGSTPSEFLKFCRAKRPYRIDITKEGNMTITHKKAAQILKSWNLTDSEIEDIYYEGTGNHNDNACYVGKEYVLKYTTNPGKLRKHMDVSAALAEVGLLSPVLIPAADGEMYVRDGEIYFYLTRRLPGKQMVSHSFAAEDGRFVGEIIGQLHLALRKIEDCVNEADLLATVRDWALPKAKDALRLSDDDCRAYLDAFAALHPLLPRQIIHRDPNPGNIICGEDRWGFIDFELAERNVRIYDICYAATAVLSETFGENNDKWLDVLGEMVLGYDSVAMLTQEERRAIPYVMLANQFVCVAWFAEQEKYKELLETNIRMTKWLMDKIDEINNVIIAT